MAGALLPSTCMATRITFRNPSRRQERASSPPGSTSLGSGSVSKLAASSAPSSVRLTTSTAPGTGAAAFLGTGSTNATRLQNERTEVRRGRVRGPRSARRVVSVPSQAHEGSRICSVGIARTASARRTCILAPRCSFILRVRQAERAHRDGFGWAAGQMLLQPQLVTTRTRDSRSATATHFRLLGS